VQFVPDGSAVLVSDADGTLHEWTAATGTVAAHWTTGVGPVVSLDVASDGDLVAVAGSSQVELWRRSTRARVDRLSGDGSGWADAKIAPSAREVLVAERSGRVRVWEVAGSTADRRVVRLGVAGPVATSAASLWAAADDRGHVSLYDAGADAPRWLFPKAPGVKAVAVDPRGTWVAAASFGGVTVRSTTSGEVRARLSATTSPPTLLAASHDGAVLGEASGGDIRLWSVAGAQLVSSIAAGDPVLSLALDLDGTRIAVGHHDGVRLYRPGADAPIVLPTRGEARALAFAPDGRALAVGDAAGSVSLYAADSGRHIASTSGHEGPVSAVAYLPDGPLLTAGHDGTLRLWDNQSGDALAIVAEGSRSIVAAGPLDRRHVAWLDETGAMTVLDLKRHEASLSGNRDWFRAAQ
jgi:WD40 repeat protein